MNSANEEKLMKCQSLHEFFAMFFGLGIEEQLSIFNDSMDIKEGAYFYRARIDDGKTDFFDKSAWGLPPKKCVNQGRLNEKHKPMLYVASDESILGREIGLKSGDKYYAAKYRCIKDFSVGTLFCNYSMVNSLIHKVVMSVVKNNLCENELQMMEKYHVGKTNKSARELWEDNLSTFYIASQLNNLYDITNKIGKLVLKNHENGIRYASAFQPIELSGCDTILTLAGAEHGNFALTEKGIENIEFEIAEERVYKQEHDLSTMIEVFAMEQRKVENE